MNLRTALVLVAGIVAALLVGAAAWVVTRPPEIETTTVVRTTTVVVARPAGDSPSAARSEARAARAPRTPRAEDDPLAELEPSPEERAWVRDALVKERARRAAAAIRPDDSGADVLRRTFDHGGDPMAALATFDAARSHVRIPDAEPVRFAANADGAPTDLNAAAKATVVEFGPGRFVIDGSRAFFDRRDDVEATEVRGAGKDATTLVLSGGQEFFFGKDARNVVLRDLTIEDPRNGDTRFDLRGTASIACENVRFVGWGTAGHGAAFGLSARAFLACRDCEFSGPGEGFVLSARGAALAVFERCTFSDAYSAFIGGGQRLPQRSTVVVRDCRFEGVRLADSRTLLQGENRPEIRIEVRGGEAEFGLPGVDEPARRQEWGEQFAASVEGMTFRPWALRFTGADLLRVLELAEAKGWTPIVHAVVAPGTRRVAPQVDLYVPEGVKGTIERRTVEYADGAIRDVPDSRRGRAGVNARSAADVAGLLPLRTLLARIPEFAEGPVTSVGYVQGSVNGTPRWTLLVQGQVFRGRVLDAATGDDLIGR